jgi:hypothetical protein
MPRAGFKTARRSRNSVAWSALLGGLILAGPGCQKHYYYYYGNSGNCPPMAPSSVVEGPVCDVSGPVIEGGTVVSSATEEPPIINRSRRNKVVVSEAYGAGKSSWKATDPDASVTRTQISGAMDDTVRK